MKQQPNFVFFDNGDGTVSYSGWLKDDSGSVQFTGVFPPNQGPLQFGTLATVKEHSSQNGYNFQISPRPTDSNMQNGQNGAKFIAPTNNQNTVLTQPIVGQSPAGVGDTVDLTFNNAAGATAAKIIIGDATGLIAAQLNTAIPEGFTTDGWLGPNSLALFNNYLKHLSVEASQLVVTASTAGFFSSGKTIIAKYDLPGNNVKKKNVNWAITGSPQDFNQNIKRANNFQIQLSPNFGLFIEIPAGMTVNFSMYIQALENAQLMGRVQ
jgi:hypothetical protein